MIDIRQNPFSRRLVSRGFTLNHKMLYQSLLYKFFYGMSIYRPWYQTEFCNLVYRDIRIFHNLIYSIVSGLCGKNNPTKNNKYCYYRCDVMFVHASMIAHCVAMVKNEDINSLSTSHIFFHGIHLGS